MEPKTGTLSDDQLAHLARVLNAHVKLTTEKYRRGQLEHSGDCWRKPGMLAHALDECADLPVYLWTLREQLTHIANRAEGRGEFETAAAIRRVMEK